MGMGTCDFPTLAMAEMRAWVISSMMWDATRNSSALQDEFIKAWYGQTAAPYIDQHMRSWSSALALMNQTSDTCEVFHVARPARCHPGLPAPANATDCRSDCVQNPLLRYGGLSECGAACNNGHDLCTGPGCFCIYPEVRALSVLATAYMMKTFFCARRFGAHVRKPKPDMHCTIFASQNCFEQPWIVTAPVMASATALHDALEQLSVLSTGHEPGGNATAASGAAVPYMRYHARVERLFLSMSYIIIFRWTEMCEFAQRHGMKWPLQRSLNASLTQWQAAMRKIGVTQIGPGHGFNIQSLRQPMYQQFIVDKHDCVIGRE